MDRFRAMRAFVATVRAGSFSAAGRALHQPASSLSRAVAALEDQLSARLLHRTTRSMSLTPQGERYYRHCVAMLSEMRAMDASLAADDGALRGFFRMTAPAVFGPLYLNRIVAAFLRDHPLVDVEVHLTGRTIDLVADGFDLAVRPRPTEDSGVVARQLGQLHMITVASPDYLAQHGVPDDRPALEHHRLALHSRRIPRTVMAAFGTSGASGSRIVSNDATTLLAMALDGIAITTLPHRQVAPFLASGQLCHILADTAEMRLTLCAIWPRGRHLSPVVRAFVDRLTAGWPRDGL